jgi:SAM-dependent methyltransferase
VKPFKLFFREKNYQNHPNPYTNKKVYLCSMEQKEWFAEWFDTPYYHILYKNRDHDEAERFINKLIKYLQIPKGAHVLDLACGKGRHALILNQLGYRVTGADLSPFSIQEAAKSAEEGLDFRVHDMRKVIPNAHYAAVFNLFTSFGYFDSQSDNLSVLKSIHAMLDPGGILVIDFMNAQKVIAGLIESETKTVENITFNIKRRYDGVHIYKEIRFEDQNTDFHFTERVQALKQDDFAQLLKLSGFNILRTFGSFDLEAFNEEKSDRLILIAQRA